MKAGKFRRSGARPGKAGLPGAEMREAAGASPRAGVKLAAQERLAVRARPDYTDGLPRCSLRLAV